MWPIAPLLSCSCLLPAHPLHVSLRSCLWGLLGARRPEGGAREQLCGRQADGLASTSPPSGTARVEEAGGDLSSGPARAPQADGCWVSVPIHTKEQVSLAASRVPQLGSCPHHGLGHSHNKALPLQGGRGRGRAKEPNEGRESQQHCSLRAPQSPPPRGERGSQSFHCVPDGSLGS